VSVALRSSAALMPVLASLQREGAAEAGPLEFLTLAGAGSPQRVATRRPAPFAFFGGLSPRLRKRATAHVGDVAMPRHRSNHRTWIRRTRNKDRRSSTGTAILS